MGALRIALFIACFNDTLFPETGKAVVRLLERLGHEVVFPEEQTCCGQMHANSGYGLEAVPLARRFVRVFGGFDTIVTPSGSCAAMVRDGYPRLAVIGIARVAVHLPAAGLLLGEHDLVPEALEQRHDRLPGGREQRVVEACDE